MSTKVMTLIWDTKTFSGNRLNVLIKMADHSNDQGANVFPSLEELADKCQVSERTVQRIQKELEADGILILERDGRGRGRTKWYRVNVERLAQLRDEAERRSAAKNAEKAAKEKATKCRVLAPKNTTSRAENTTQLCHPEPIKQITTTTARATLHVSPEAVEIIAAFDRAIVVAWGESQARICPHATDGVTAGRWLEAGATPAQLGGIFEAALPRMAARGKGPPGALSNLSRTVDDALAGQRPVPHGAAPARAALDPREFTPTPEPSQAVRDMRARLKAKGHDLWGDDD